MLLAPGPGNLNLGVVRHLVTRLPIAAFSARISQRGDWLTPEQATPLWQTPSEDRLKGVRDRALFVQYPPAPAPSQASGASRH